MTARSKSSPDLAALTALEALGTLSAVERRSLARAKKSATPPQHAAGAAMANLPLALAAGSPSHPAPPNLKGRVMAAIGAGERSKLVEARQVGFFAYAGDAGAWRPHAVPGVQYRVLSVNSRSDYAMTLFKLNPGAVFPEHKHDGSEECFVLAGDLHVDGRVLHTGDFHHAEQGTEHGVSMTEGGCTLLIVSAAGDYA